MFYLIVFNMLNKLKYIKGMYYSNTFYFLLWYGVVWNDISK